MQNYKIKPILTSFKESFDEPIESTEECLSEASKLKNVWFHGDPNKREHFCDQKMDRVPFKEDPNANGPGIYFTDDYVQARGYAEPDGYVYTCKINLDAGYIIKEKDKAVNNKKLLFNLIKKAQLHDSQTVYYAVTDYGVEIMNVEDVTDRHIKLIIDKYLSVLSLIGAVISIYKEFWGREANPWTQAMVELGVLGYLQKQPEALHLILYNCNAITIVKEEKYVNAINESVIMTETETFQQSVMKNPDFIKWFNGSKAVDKNGNPMVMFHGTQSDEHFTVFSVDGIPYIEDDDADEEAIRDPGSGADPNAFTGAHFAQEPEVASKFATANVDWLKKRSAGRTGSGRVYPVFLKVKNPILFKTEEAFNDFIYSQDVNSDYVENALYDLQEDGNDYDDLVEEYEKSAKKRLEVNMYAMSLANNMDDASSGFNHPLEYARELGYNARQVLMNAGYDGIKYKNDIEGGISWVVFQPNQIKSALGSAYTDDPDIMKEENKKIATPSYLLKYIDTNTKGNLNYGELRKNLNTSKYYTLGHVDISKLKIQDEDIVSNEIQSQFESDKPIVIDKDYFIIDGRHRAVNEKNKGKKNILAWIPTDMNIDDKKYDEYDVIEENKSFKKYIKGI